MTGGVPTTWEKSHTEQMFNIGLILKAYLFCFEGLHALPVMSLFIKITLHIKSKVILMVIFLVVLTSDLSLVAQSIM